MEPGHEDREYNSGHSSPTPSTRASMEPGHEDREYVGGVRELEDFAPRLNGARS